MVVLQIFLFLDLAKAQPVQTIAKNEGGGDYKSGLGYATCFKVFH
jgi:hypothetical protein